MFNQNDINSLINIIPTGRQNAITAYIIAQSLGYPTGGNQVKTRNLIKFAIASGNLILSSSNENPKGYWISIDKSEIVDTISSLEHRANEILDRANNLKNNWNNINPQNIIT